MKLGMCKPSPKKSFRARTTGKWKRKAKKAVNPFYGKKEVGVETPVPVHPCDAGGGGVFYLFPHQNNIRGNIRCGVPQPRISKLRIILLPLWTVVWTVVRTIVPDRIQFCATICKS